MPNLFFRSTLFRSCCSREYHFIDENETIWIRFTRNLCKTLFINFLFELTARNFFGQEFGPKFSENNENFLNLWIFYRLRSYDQIQGIISVLCFSVLQSHRQPQFVGQILHVTSSWSLILTMLIIKPFNDSVNGRSWYSSGFTQWSDTYSFVINLFDLLFCLDINISVLCH